MGHQIISQQDGSGDPIILLHDGHGSVRLLLDALGAIAVVATAEQVFHYTAYGVAHGFNPSQAATNRLFNSEPRDTATGLYYHDARWLDPVTGRWNRLDPFFGNHFDPQSFHKSLYVHADPINFIDPLGMNSTTIGNLGGLQGIGIIAAKTVVAVTSGYILAQGVQQYEFTGPMSD